MDNTYTPTPFLAGEVSMPLMRLFREHIHKRLMQMEAQGGVKPSWAKSFYGLDSTNPHSPQILLSLGYDNIFIQLFNSRKNKENLFQSFPGIKQSSQFENTTDPSGLLSMYSGTPYVMLVDMRRLGPQPIPAHWSDLMNDVYRGEVLVPGSPRGISTIMLLHYYSRHGMQGLKQFAANVSACVHASWVCRSAHEGAVPYAISVVPWMFAKCANLPDTKIIWPEEGAIFSPMWMSVKKNCSPQATHLAEEICMGSFARSASALFFPFADVRVNTTQSNMQNNKLLWPGWPFLESAGNIEQLQSRLKLESTRYNTQQHKGVENFIINKAS